MHRRTIFSASFVIILFFMVITIGFVFEESEESEATDTHKDVNVMYAGSLVKIMEDSIGPSFRNHTGYDIIGEGKGSVQISNLIIDGFRRPDLFISADTLPIEKIINHNPPLAQWLVKFASAELVIAYNPKSTFAPDLEKAARGEIPWYKVLEEKGFKFRRTDPELDPKGYYTVIVAKLSNIYYNDTTIKNNVLGADRNPEQIFPEEVLRSILESGQIDAIAAYKHEAIARGLPYITLAPQINLGDPKYSHFYNQVSYTLHSNETISGRSIFFSYTIPTTVRNLDGAKSFADFLISTQGKTVLNQVGLNPVKAVVDGDNKSLTLPFEIKSLIK
jgi:molybdate/tungstate transport system substrate-binding protein